MPTIDQFNRNDLLILLQNARPHIQNQHSMLSRIITIRNYMQHQANILSEKKTHITATAIVVTLCIMLTIGNFFTFLIVCTYKEMTATTHISIHDQFANSFKISLLIVIILTIIICLLEEAIYRLSYKKAVKNYNKKLETAKIDVAQAVQFIHNNTAQHYELQIIPFDYQNNEIIGIACNYLNNFRASCWSEAINLYEHERQLRQINQALQRNYQMLVQEMTLLKSIQSDINFNALATAGLIFFS